MGPVGEYAQSRLGGERLAEFAAQKGETPLAIARLFYAARSNPARAGRLHCGLHDPTIGTAARQAGGRARAQSLAPAFLTPSEADSAIKLRQAQDVPSTLEHIARAVASGRLEVRAGNCVVIAASAAVRANDAADLGRRLELLEAAVGGRR